MCPSLPLFYSNSHLIQSETSLILIPLAIHTIGVFSNHSHVLISGLISRHRHDVIDGVPDLLTGPAHYHESLTSEPCVLHSCKPSSAGHYKHHPPHPFMPRMLCQTLTETWREDAERRLMRERRGLDSD